MVKEKMEAEEKELIKKQIRINRLKIIVDVILIIVISAIGYYIFREIELFKILGKDVCNLCMEKTGAVCSKLNLGL